MTRQSGRGLAQAFGALASPGHPDVARSQECGRRFRRQMRGYRACSVLQHARGCEDYPHREREYAGEQQDLIQDPNRHCSLPVCVPNAPQYRGWKTTAKCLDEGDWNSEVPKPVYNCQRKTILTVRCPTQENFLDQTKFRQVALNHCKLDSSRSPVAPLPYGAGGRAADGLRPQTQPPWPPRCDDGAGRLPPRLAGL